MATAILQREANVDAREPQLTQPRVQPWTSWQLISFRVAFLFILQLTLPLSARWYKSLLTIRTMRQLYALPLGLGAHYVTDFLGAGAITLRSESSRWGIGSFANWGIALAVAAIGAAIWTWFARKSGRTEYNALNYWLRLLVRYWVALSIMSYGIIKVFPMQMPFPSLSNLHTLFGEHAAYRLYWQHVGLVTWYEVVLGTLETISGMLLFFRRTTALGAVLGMGILFNVAHSNFAYDGGVHVLSTEISLLAGFLLVQYIPDLWRLLIKKEDVQPSYYRLVFKKKWQRYAFQTAKVLAWILFIPVFVYADYNLFHNTNLSKEPRSPGLTGAQGYYNVTEFQLNGKVLPYSPLDPIRWHDVVFEDYPTLTYKVGRALPIRVENGGSAYRDFDKRYELAGFAGGRVYLHYDVDEANQILYLQDKNVPAARAGGPAPNPRGGKPQAGAREKPKRAEPEKLAWHYSRPSDSRIILSGLDENKNSIYVVLDRVKEQYPIQIESPVQGQAVRYDRTFARRYPVHDKSFDGKGAPPPNPDAGDDTP
jgi:hypothetical protein